MIRNKPARDFQGIWQACGLVVLGLVVFWPALNGSWLVNWDDDSVILRDGRLRNLAGLGAIWIPTSGVDYWPLTSSFLWIEWHLFSNQAFGYHVCSWAFHVADAFLIWRLFSRLGLRWSWLGALLFLIHPLSVESVAWISETKNPLSLLFFLISLISYLSFDENGRDSDYWKSFGFYVAAMLAKTSVVMLPAVLLLYCWWKRDAISLIDLKRTAPYFAVALALGLITVFLQNQHALSDAYPPRSLEVIFLCAGEAIFFYVGHFFFPFGLSVIYPRWTFDPPSLLQFSTLPALCLLLVLLWLRRHGWERHALFGIGFFLITVLPVVGLLNMTFMKISWAADHLEYLPMIGLIGLVVAGLENVHGRINPVTRVWSGAVLVVGLACLAFQSYVHANTFCNEETLWRETIKINPDSWQAHNNLGLTFRNSRRLYDAINEFQVALKLAPNVAEVHNNLGAAYQFTDQPSEAIEQYEAAVKLKPDYFGMQLNLGQLLLLQGRLPEAVDHLEQAVKLSPSEPNAQNNLGYAFLQLGRVSDAIPHFQQALQSSPGFVTAHLNLGNALADLNRYSEALNEFQMVRQLAPNTPGIDELLEKTRELEAASLKTN